MTGLLDVLDGDLAPDVVFFSPAAEYRGRAEVAHVLNLAAQVLGDVRRTRSWAGGDEDVHAFTARATDIELDGMLRVQRSPAGEIASLTLFLRPYATLGVAIERMLALARPDR